MKKVMRPEFEDNIFSKRQTMSASSKIIPSKVKSKYDLEAIKLREKRERDTNRNYKSSNPKHHTKKQQQPQNRKGSSFE